MVEVGQKVVLSVEERPMLIYRTTIYKLVIGDDDTRRYISALDTFNFILKKYNLKL